MFPTFFYRSFFLMNTTVPPDFCHRAVWWGTRLVSVSWQFCCTYWRVTGSPDSCKRKARPREPPANVCEPPSTPSPGHMQSLCVCVCVCAYRHIRAYLKNKELFIGMIFSLLLADVLLLKFHYLLWQVDLFRELDCKNLFLVACPASRSSPLLPHSLLLASSRARSSS